MSLTLPISVHPLELVAFFIIALCCGMTSTYLFHTMRLEVNERLPAADRLGVLFGSPGLLGRVERLHREFYPGSWLRTVLNALIGVGFASVVGLTHAMGIVDAFLKTMNQ